MLTREHRLTDSRGFTAATRGHRAGARGVVVHRARASAGEVPARAGLIVSKAVGNAVVRTRVKRRLRHVLRERVAALPNGVTLAVRALPVAAQMSSAELAADVDRCLARLELAPVPA